MKKRVLVVDDEADITLSVKMLIENMGYECKLANSGKEALELLKKEKFDLVLLDILMPQMSGRQVLEKIRADSKLKNQKVAFMTVIQLSANGENFIKKLRPIEYFQKPILDIKEFKIKLNRILNP
jgi:CheY-like chemotaxis protein